MVHKFSGTFTVIDGLDGVGKGTVQKSIIKHLSNKKQRILDLHQFWEKFHDHPDFTHEFIQGEKNPLYIDLNSFDVISSSEPTHVGIGMVIRKEITVRNQRNYSAHMTARLYAADRKVLYQRVILPALKAGKHIIQQRSVSTSIVYQPLQKKFLKEPELSISKILRLDGNDLALKHSPNLLIIPTIEDMQGLIERLTTRVKQENCEFESLKFQEKIKPLYESKLLRQIFESRGTKVAYLDAGISVKESKKQAVDIFKKTFPDI